MVFSDISCRNNVLMLCPLRLNCPSFVTSSRTQKRGRADAYGPKRECKGQGVRRERAWGAGTRGRRGERGCKGPGAPRSTVWKVIGRKTVNHCKGTPSSRASSVSVRERGDIVTERKWFSREHDIARERNTIVNIERECTG